MRNQFLFALLVCDCSYLYDGILQRQYRRIKKIKLAGKPQQCTLITVVPWNWRPQLRQLGAKTETKQKLQNYKNLILKSTYDQLKNKRLS